MSKAVKPTLFTEAEINYLLGRSDPNANYSRVLKHRIIKKLKEFETLIWPILRNNPLTQDWTKDFITRAVTTTCNTITTGSNTSRTEVTTPTCNETRWAGPDLNRRPSPCESDVLPS